MKSEARSTLLTWRSQCAAALRNRAPWLLPAKWRRPGSFSGPRPT
jgi:hypothetical protein